MFGGKMPRPQLSPRVQQIFDFISTYASQHGYPPSVREIGSSVGLKSPSTVHMHLQTLEEKGLIKRIANKSRTIELVSDATQKASSEKAAHPNNVIAIDQNLNSNTIKLPLIGRVAAGTPILAEENIEDVMTVPTSLVGDAASFLLRVAGNSMINAGILDGDYVAIVQTPDAHNGEIVVALLGESATVKTFYKEKNRVRLQPENYAMEPIYAKDPKIIGRVSALIRRF